MSFCYCVATTDHIRQGEVIQNVVELRPAVSSLQSLSVEAVTASDKIEYPYALVVSQDCDLEWDYKARLGEGPSTKKVEHILMCELFLDSEIRGRNDFNADLFKRASENQVLRYHKIDHAPIGDGPDSLPALYADFKATFSLPTDFFYWLLVKGIAARKGYLPSPFLEQFIQRLHSFLGRVATPIA